MHNDSSAIYAKRPNEIGELSRLLCEPLSQRPTERRENLSTLDESSAIRGLISGAFPLAREKPVVIKKY